MGLLERGEYPCHLDCSAVLRIPFCFLWPAGIRCSASNAKARRHLGLCRRKLAPSVFKGSTLALDREGFMIWVQSKSEILNPSTLHSGISNRLKSLKVFVLCNAEFRV